MVERRRKGGAGMTNKEKFEEVFSFKPNTWIKPCELFKIEIGDEICKAHLTCDDCPYNRNWWDREYSREVNDYAIHI